MKVEEIESVDKITPDIGILVSGRDENNNLVPEYLRIQDIIESEVGNG